MGILEDILEEVRGIKQAVDELREEVWSNKSPENDEDRCLYPRCKSKGYKECRCGDHSYGPDVRDYGKKMCMTHTKEHGSCAGWGNW